MADVFINVSTASKNILYSVFLCQIYLCWQFDNQKHNRYTSTFYIYSYRIKLVFKSLNYITFLV